MQHLVPLATDYWAASHSFIEPGHSRFGWKFEKIVVFPKFWQEECSGGARRLAWKRSGLRRNLNAAVSKVDNLVWLPRA